MLKSVSPTSRPAISVMTLPPQLRTDLGIGSLGVGVADAADASRNREEMTNFIGTLSFLNYNLLLDASYVLYTLE